ncbi:MAG: 50S ribosomal protein L17 [Candidatus Paceibacterota bacterium]
MFKKNKGRKFHRKTDQRRIFFRSLVEALVKYGKITTTEARAKEIRGKIERLITRAKKQDLAALRYINSYVGEEASKKIIKEIAPKYTDRKGGYTRVTKLGQRKGDSARMAVIELI